jgi:serine/threonine-protein phosphatase 2B catalytic subunit
MGNYSFFKAKEPNMVKVPEPAVVVGDVHGQYYDLLTLLEVNK